MRRFLSAGVIVLAMAGNAQAAPHCTPTDRLVTEGYPAAENIPNSNNLLLPTGKPLLAEGQKFTLIGRVMDRNCKPVTEAVVELWQNNPFGRWLLASPADRAMPYPVFAGAGRTYTDHLGRFVFISAFPAPLGKRAPFINLRIAGEGIPHRATSLFFAGDVRNGGDPTYRQLSTKAKQDLTIKLEMDSEGELIGTVDIVLDAKVPYRTY